MQCPDFDLLAAIIHNIKEIQLSIKKLRQNEVFFNCHIQEMNSFINDKKEFEFDELKIPRSRKKKRMADEICEDETIINPIDKFKIDTYFTCMDMINVYLNEYFSTSAVGIYRDLALLSKLRILEIKKNPLLFPEDSFSSLCNTYDKFLDQDQLKKEYLQFCQVYCSFEKTLNIPLKLHSEE